MINSQNLTGSYIEFFLSAVRTLEGHINVPYDDRTSRHVPTIGDGINLWERNYLALVLDELGVFEASDANAPANETAVQQNVRYAGIIADFIEILSRQENPLDVAANDPVARGNSNSETILQSELNTELQIYFPDNPGIEFALTEEQSRNIVDLIISGFTLGNITDNGKQARLDARLGIAIPHDTREYTALMLMFYNNEANLIGPRLRAALRQPNAAEARAEAWFEIRYNSNNGATRSRGIAKRRYIESEIFGLYDNPAVVNDDTAKQVYRMYTRHRHAIFREEREWGEGQGQNINRNMILAANRDFNITNVNTGAQLSAQLGNDFQIQTLQASFAEAYAYLYEHYVANPILAREPSAVLPVIDYRDVLVGSNLADPQLQMTAGGRDGFNLVGSNLPEQSYLILGEGGDDRIYGGNLADVLHGGAGRDTLIGNAGDDWLFGGADNDVLQGGEGADHLYGGDGNDILEGGPGDDVLDGGAGHDVYIFRAGHGNDRIIDTGANTIIYIDDNGVSHHIDWAIASGQGQYTTANGQFTLTHNSPLTITNNQTGETITIGNSAGDWREGDFGIRLIDAPRDPVLPTPRREIVGDYEWAQDADAGRSGYWPYFNLNVALLPSHPNYPNPPTNGVYNPNWSDHLLGGAGNDRIDSGGGADLVSAFDGDDIILGGDNQTGYVVLGRLYLADYLSGGPGNDFIDGQDGTDVIDGGSGSDWLRGGAGDDWIWSGRYEYFRGDLVYTDFTFTTQASQIGGLDRVEAIRNPFTGESVGYPFFSFVPPANGDTLAADGDNLLEGGPGSDVLMAQEGNDRLYADEQMALADFLASDTGEATMDRDFLSGGGGDDIVVGSHGDNLISGGAGRDVILGGSGNDFIHGDATYEFVLTVRTNFDLDTWNLTWTPIVDPDGIHVRFENVRDQIPNNVNSGDDLIYAGSGDDYAWGGGGNDILYGGSGADVLVGDDGNDTVFGEDGDDRLLGDNDSLHGSLHGQDYLSGGAGNDLIAGGGDDDILDGGDGDDTLLGDSDVEGRYHGNDILYGGAGNDTLVGQGGSDSLFGGDGDDILIGDDRVEAAFQGDDYLDGGAGNDNLQGNGGNDVLFGGDGDDVLHGDDRFSDVRYHGNDILYGGNGNDTLVGGHGNDILDGGAGDDILDGSDDQDADVLIGGPGRDRFIAGSNDTIEDAEPDDHIAILGENVTVRFSGILSSDASLRSGLGENGLPSLQLGTGGGTINLLNAGVDRGQRYVFEDGVADQRRLMDLASGPLTLFATTPNSVLYGGRYNDTLIGSNGQDTLRGQGGDDELQGGAGNDTYVFHRGDGRDVIDAQSLTVQVTARDRDGMSVSDDFTLTLQHLVTANMLNGYGGDDELHGGDGDDRLDGGRGNDRLFGGRGDDTYIYNRGDGWDWIIDDHGMNSVRFGEGIAVQDVIARRQANGDVTTVSVQVLGGDGTASADGGMRFDLNTDGSSPIRAFIFSDGRRLSLNDILVRQVTHDGTACDDVIVTGHHDDLIYARQGDDIVRAGAGNDIVYGQQGNDWLYGEQGDDRLYGEQGQDVLFGGAGFDQLYGGVGRDRLYGGSENDLLSGGNARDELYGGEGNDLLVGGRGDDVLDVQHGRDVILYNLGDGADVIRRSAESQGLTLSLGGGVRWQDLYLCRDGDDLSLHVLHERVAADGYRWLDDQGSLTLENWFGGNHGLTQSPAITLQMFTEATAQFDRTSSNPLYRQRIQQFDFNSLVSRFILDGQPSDAWSIMHGLLDAHIGGSDEDALGGELAYRYGLNGDSSAWDERAQTVLADARFGSVAQAVR